MTIITQITVINYNNNIIVFHVGNHYPPVILLWQ